MIERKIRRRVPEWTVKIVSFLAIVSAAYYLMIRFMGVEFEEIGKYGRAAIPLLLLFGAIAFVAYDFCLTLFVSEYLRRWQKRFHKRFRL